MTAEKKKAGVPRPTVTVFATQLAAQVAEHPELGKLCRLGIESGDLAIEVFFPLEFAGPIGEELGNLKESDLVAAKPEDVERAARGLEAIKGGKNGA